jgi:2-dehydrotetronate isomerase
MIKLAANLSFLFLEVPFLERFEAAAQAGFRAVEFAYAFDVPARDIAARLRDNGLKLTLINTPPGNSSAGELGLAVLAGRQHDLAGALERALEYAVALDAPLVHFLSGNTPAGCSRESVDAVLIENIARAADLAARAGRILTLEPLNERTRPGYHLKTNAQARALIKAAGRDNVMLQLDLFHCQISEGDLTFNIERNIDLIAHVQTAGVPDRHEPIFGEIAHDYVLNRLDKLGYSGYVGCEYVPRAGTLAGLGWAEQYLQGPADTY